MTVAPDADSPTVEPTQETVNPDQDRVVELDYEESKDYPVLQAVLLGYFGSAVYRRPDRSQVFVDRYQEHGEDQAEFEGLAGELRKAIRSPKSATPMLNEALGTEMEPLEVRNHLAALLDQITQQGAFDEQAAEEKAEQERAERAAKAPSPDDLLDNYFWRKVKIPFLQGRQVPLWLLLASGFGIGAFGIGVDQFKLPGWLEWVPVMFIALGLAIIGLTAGAMRGLREELRRPEREAKRAAEQAAAEAKRSARKSERRKLSDLL